MKLESRPSTELGAMERGAFYRIPLHFVGHQPNALKGRSMVDTLLDSTLVVRKAPGLVLLIRLAALGSLLGWYSAELLEGWPQNR